MMKMKMLCFKLLFVFLMASSSKSMVARERSDRSKKTYIIQMDKTKMPHTFNGYFHWYESSLKSVSDTAEMLYTYNTLINGFSTRLTAEEAKSMENRPGILSVHPELNYELHTTRTPKFLGLENMESFFPETEMVSEVIVGVLDTGAWPESESYSDEGFGPVPASWKGECELGNNFNSSSCNKKLIGARFFSKGYEAELGPIDETRESNSPRDDDGHGTHTSTTVIGSSCPGASLCGFANGTARGMDSKARIAIYKICWLRGCHFSDFLAGLEKAVEDGVNVISMSAGASPKDYYDDIVAIGAFKAAAKGVFVSFSAGNYGPVAGSVTNVAPWITTVGAGTLDRNFPAYIRLGNSKNYTGVALYSGKPLSETLLPVVYAGQVSYSTYGPLCIEGSLIPEKVAGKIVVCDDGYIRRALKGWVVKEAGGAGIILANTNIDGENLVADLHFLPASAVGKKIGDEIKRYVFSEANPTATITQGATEVGVHPSPVVASFSSRGPNPITSEILKPDLIAPGVNILAAWSGAAGPTNLKEDKRRVKFNIVSGTSMSCPHVSGLAALLKAAHPEWSPSAIKSALMTTAYATYKNGKTIQDESTDEAASPFVFGSGHVNPVTALDPGLVYETTIDDYLNFLCAIDYDSSQIKIVTGQDFTCETTKKYSVGDFNYPSFAVPLETTSGEPITVKHTRTLTNVGIPATYNVSVSTPWSVKITVEPESLSFTEANEKKSFTVTFTAMSMPPGTTSFGRLEWLDGNHTVGSPIAFSWHTKN